MTMFPAAFIQELSSIFDSHILSTLLDSLQEPQPTSVRLNPFYRGKLTVSHEKIGQSDLGYFISERPVFTADPAFHAGAYYPQEANSMWIGSVFSYLRTSYYQNSDGVTVLDLCAAPGGKTTDISSRMSENDLLVSNEVISSRNSILFENVCKWGIANTVITKADAQRFGEKGPTFDLIFCDAPCSGEGLFRKDNAAISEWSSETVVLCSQRQQRILFDVWNALKPGGFLVYSTCTFNRSENETNIQKFCAATSGELIPFEHPYSRVLFELEPNMYRCLPHLTAGEGLFFCIIRKPDGLYRPKTKETSPRKKNTKKGSATIEIPGFQVIHKGEDAYFLRGQHDTQFIENLPNVIHPGIPSGPVFSGKWKPHPAVALLKAATIPLPIVSLDNDLGMLYLKREFVQQKSNIQGPVIVEWNGHRLGTANAVKNGLNNLLPMEWRVRGNFHAHSIVEDN